jgi:Domain of unknown function (DUF4386)
MNSASVQRYARSGGVLLLVSLVAGGFGELYVPTKLLVSADPGATARNIAASASLFRLGFAGYLVEAVCDVALTLILYVLLKPVSKNLALLAAFYGLVGTAVFAFGELFYFSTSLLLGGAEYLKSFSPDQLQTLALLALKVSGLSGGILMVFGGVGSLVIGYLILQSGYLPRFLGALWGLGGLGFVVRNFALVLAPAYAFDWLLLPMTLAMLAAALWLIVRGVNLDRWADRGLGSLASPRDD